MINKHSVITILGGSGFVGSTIAKYIASTGARLKIVARNAEGEAKKTKVSGYVGQVALINCDVHNEKQLEKVINGSDVVINCVGIIFSRGKQSYDELHHKFVKRLVALCKSHNVKKLVHISALGAGRILTSEYAKSKILGEKEIINSGIEYTIFRPSVIFGPADSFINLFMFLAKYSPVIPLIGGGKNKVQPIYVDDLAQAVLKSLTTHVNESKNLCLEVGGPKIYKMSEIVDLILEHMKTSRFKLNIPLPLAKVQAFFMELTPKPFFTRDQVELVRYDNILPANNDIMIFGIKPTTLESIIDSYIA